MPTYRGPCASGVDDERAGAGAGADEERHRSPIEQELAPPPALWPGFCAGRQERAIGDADARKIEHRP